ncbi:methyltransferase domain-containing protein [Colletotrichum incanum]|uniref:Methyltransferase domain-containing protein n=1 Tax=Colletotrichum incanum TaxID=1573173 RepID=A0A161YDQ8_COLIC|nr:methyltransferase domain-containing protein [Colletotrichum incanum]OHW90320.1 methyltransferase domain-containing protein [Colletotrichum incanum]
MTEPTADGSMASWTNTIYNLNRGSIDDELERLAYNHFNIWTPLTVDLLPPHILSSLQSQDRPRVADVATGSGVWLTSLADDLPPHSELFGFDFDKLKFPPRPPTPPIPPPPVSPPLRPEQPRLDFREQNVLEPFPGELWGTFDLVHVRLLALGLKAGDWDGVLRNLFDLLKPGGWLLWEDTGDLFMRAFPLSRAYEEFWWASMKHDTKAGRDSLMPAALLKKLQRLGFQSCEQKVWSSWAADESIQEKASRGVLRLVKPGLAAVVEDGGEETVRTMEDASRIEREMARDIEENGVRIGFHYFWNWGQRPS